MTAKQMNKPNNSQCNEMTANATQHNKTIANATQCNEAIANAMKGQPASVTQQTKGQPKEQMK